MTLLRRLIAFVLSFRKRDWTVHDYPVHFRLQDEPRLWVARIHGWAMLAAGETKEEALQELQKLIDDYRDGGEPLPRPGTSVPIRFGEIQFLSRHEDLARELFPPILGYDYDDCLITEQSSVWDFPVEFRAEELARKVLLVFDTDISDLAEEGNIAAILDRIAAKRGGG